MFKATILSINTFQWLIVLFVIFLRPGMFSKIETFPQCTPYMYILMWAQTFSTAVYIYIYMYIYMHVCMYVCMYVYLLNAILYTRVRTGFSANQITWLSVNIYSIETRRIKSQIFWPCENLIKIKPSQLTNVEK